MPQLITAQLVEAAASEGRDRVELPTGAIVTPAARDRASELRVSIGGNGAATASHPNPTRPAQMDVSATAPRGGPARPSTTWAGSGGPQRTTSGFVDADTHVIETATAWSYADPADERYMPRPVEGVGSRSGDFWYADGQMVPRGALNPNDAYGEGTRDLADVDARIDHMDRLGVEIQVLFPSFFLLAVYQHPEPQVAACRSYNRWLADVCSRARGRIRWGLMPPLLDMNETISELRFGKENGACSIVLQGVEIERMLTDPYFTPLYEEASRLDLALSIHIGVTNRRMGELGMHGGVMLLVSNNLVAFHSLICSDITTRFPKLRFGFLESGSQWLPFALQEARRAAASLGGYEFSDSDTGGSFPFFVACQVDDDLPYVLNNFPQDRLVLGSDYGHADIGWDMEGHRILAERTDVDPAILQKIVNTNGRLLYGL